jgi:hypothetical protein
MLFKDFDYRGPQILEGIDKIKAMLQPAIYPFLDFGKERQIDSRTAVSLIETTGASVPYAKYYVYLNIQGEFIDHTLNMKLNISRALVLLMQKRVLDFRIGRFLDNETLLSIISTNLHLFIRGINEVEFFADFRPECISIAKDVEIIETSDICAFNRFKNLRINNRAMPLIHCKNTYYSYDYKSHRDSTISLYDRATRLREEGNVYPQKIINANPYKTRIEFRLKKNNNYKVLAVENLNGNYFTIFDAYAGLLTARFRKYFYGLVYVNSTEHPLFNRIYRGAAQDSKIRNTKSVLRSNLDEKIRYRDVSDKDRMQRIFDLLPHAEQDSKNDIQDIPDSAFVNLYDPDNAHTHGPFDYKNPEKIFLKDDGFTMFKNDFIGIGGKYISLPEDNEGMGNTINNDEDEGFSNDDMMQGKFGAALDNKDNIDYEADDFILD